MKKVTLFVAILGVIFCTSCNHNIELPFSDQEVITLHHGEEFQIAATSNKTISYSSSNEYCASVDETGLVKANYVGESTITLTNGKDSKTLTVKVEPVCTKYEIPSVQIGQSKASIIEQFGNPALEDGSTLAYVSLFGYTMVAFDFDENDNLTIMACANMANEAENMATFISERYHFFKEYTESEDLSGNMYINALKIENADQMVLHTVYSGFSVFEFSTPEIMNSDDFVSKKSSQKMIKSLRK